VALGTDGYPSSMDDEMQVLVEEGERAGEPRERLDARRAAGARLIAERFGGMDAMAPELTTGIVDAIRAEARDAAPRLWARMMTV
jgi:hypothetical protein